MSFIKIIDSDESNIFTDIDWDSSYLYWCDKLELQKLITVKEDLRYIPCCLYDTIDYNDLKGKNILIFFCVICSEIN